MEQVLKAITIDDLGVVVVKLPTGTYLIDGEVVVSEYSYNQAQREIAVKDLENIRAISTVAHKTHYVSESGETLPVDDYQEELIKLSKYSTFDGADEDEITWDSLEDEFAYRKFKQTWKAVYKKETVYSEPMLVDKTHIRQDTGNPYIVAGYLTGRADVPLYSYSRTQAMHHLVSDKFKSLGMDFVKGVSYSSTEGKKVWGNSDHSGLEYLVAFGKYIIGKNLVAKTRGEFKGSLEQLQKTFQEDKKWIEDLIQTHYNLHFRNESASTMLLSEVYNGVKTCLNYVNTMDVKVKSETSKRSAVQQLTKLLDAVNKEILEK